MPLTDREAKVLNEIQDWEKNLLEYEPNDFQLTYEKYLNKPSHYYLKRFNSNFFQLLIVGCFIYMV